MAKLCMGLQQYGQSAEAQKKPRCRPFDPCPSLQPTVSGHREQQPKWAQREALRTALHVCSSGSPKGHSRGAGPSFQHLCACQAQVALSADMLCLASMLSCAPQLPGELQQAVQSDKRSMCTQDAVGSRTLLSVQIGMQHVRLVKLRHACHATSLICAYLRMLRNGRRERRCKCSGRTESSLTHPGSSSAKVPAAAKIW